MGRTPKKASKSQLVVKSGNGHKRNELDKTADMWFAVKELAKGKEYREIAEELKQRNGYSISYVQVWHDVEEALVEWKRQNMENIDAYIAKDLARLEEIERIVMQNFEASKTLSPTDYAALMKRGYTQEEIDDMYKDKPLAGDPRFLDTLLRVQLQRMKLLGIDKGMDVAQQTIVNYNFGDSRLEDLASLADALQEKKRKEIIIDEQ